MESDQEDRTKLMTDIVEFLRARIAEDEQAARDAGWRRGTWTYEGGTVLGDDMSWIVARGPYAGDLDDREGAHIARWDPARVLAECEARESLVREAQRVLSAYPDRSDHRMDQSRSWAEFVLKTLALPYADHPEYDQEWKP